MEKKQLPKRIKNLLNEIYRITGEKRFIVYGGVPIDILLNKNPKINDLDIAIKGIFNYKIAKCRERIKKAGFEITEPFRKYFIYLNEKVILIYANKGGMNIDVGFLKRLDLIGQFNIETLYFRYPQFDYVDKFNALNSLKKKTISLVRKKKENPYILLRRFLHLCSKYDIPLIKRVHKKILLRIKDNINKWNLNNKYSQQAYTICISSLLKDILTAKNKIRFIRELIKLKIIEIIFPEFRTLNMKEEKELFKNLIKSKSKTDIAKKIIKYIDKKRRNKFQNKIRTLKMRRWDQQDVRCAEYFYNTKN